MYRAFEHKDASVGRKTLNKPQPPRIEKVVQEATLGEGSIMKDVVNMVINKDGEDYMMYQINLKQYMSDLIKYEDKPRKMLQHHHRPV